MTFTKFTDAQWAEIQAARADWPADIDWPAVRLELEQAGRDFWAMRVNRLRRSPKAERTRLRRALKHLRELEHDLSELEIMHTFIGLERGLKNRLEIYEIWSGRSFESQADAHRDFLYWRTLMQWTGPLKGELKFSRVGPLMRYLTTVLMAILGDKAPKRGGLAGIILKERKRRTDFPTTFKRWEKLFSKLKPPATQS